MEQLSKSLSFTRLFTTILCSVIGFSNCFNEQILTATSVAPAICTRIREKTAGINDSPRESFMTSLSPTQTTFEIVSTQNLLKHSHCVAIFVPPIESKMAYI